MTPERALELWRERRELAAYGAVPGSIPTASPKRTAGYRVVPGRFSADADPGKQGRYSMFLVDALRGTSLEELRAENPAEADEFWEASAPARNAQRERVDAYIASVRAALAPSVDTGAPREDWEVAAATELEQSSRPLVERQLGLF